MAKRKKTGFIPILISGFIGSGKSTLGKALARKYYATYLSGSMIHRQIMEERLHAKFKKEKKIENGFWESEMGRKGTQLRANDLSIDREVDVRMLKEIKKHPRCVSDCRLAPWLYRGKAIRIWLGSSEVERIKRVAGRDHLSLADVKKTIRKRNKGDTRIYWKLYGIDFGRDFTPFDLVLDNSTLKPKQTYNLVETFIRSRLAARSAKKWN